MAYSEAVYTLRRPNDGVGSTLAESQRIFHTETFVVSQVAGS